mmetsp:Transcript_22588/g.47533  ORF Transcript_22588/g.47533 Transcript_22588/m.47533 type:complete len:218 (+) Transcript_22588:1485-2138(+)
MKVSAVSDPRHKQLRLLASDGEPLQKVLDDPLARPSLACGVLANARERCLPIKRAVEPEQQFHPLHLAKRRAVGENVVGEHRRIGSPFDQHQHGVGVPRARCRLQRLVVQHTHARFGVQQHLDSRTATARRRTPKGQPFESVGICVLGQKQLHCSGIAFIGRTCKSDIDRAHDCAVGSAIDLVAATATGAVRYTSAGFEFFENARGGCCALCLDQLD